MFLGTEGHRLKSEEKAVRYVAYTFNEAPDDYDSARPGYPSRLMEEVASRVPPGGSVLEVGCGTGQATGQISNRGFRVTCLDIGEDLIRKARENIKDGQVNFVNRSFESWTPDHNNYDLVFSATAWHWVDPGNKYRKAASVLREGGWLALIWNKHPAPYRGFFTDVQRVYREHVPEWGDPLTKQSTEEWIKVQAQEIRDSGYFAGVSVAVERWSIRYTSNEYLELLNTFSDHRQLEEQTKTRLFNGVKKIIDEEYGGHVDRPYLTALFTALKK